MVVAPSGSEKTKRYFIPSVLSLDGSIIITNSIGETLVQAFGAENLISIDHFVRWDGQTDERRTKLLPHDCVRTLAADNAICITGNVAPITLQTLPHFRSRVFAGFLKKKPTGMIQLRELPQWDCIPV